MRFWARTFAGAFAAAALVGAAQLGVAYGLAALRLDRSFVESENDWNLQLTWIAWFVMTAVIAGAGYAAGQARLRGRRVGAGVRLVAAIAAGVGGLISTLPLTVYPAVNAKLSTPIHPALTMALTVTVAAIAGAVLAALVAGSPPLTTNIAVTSAALWILAAVSFADSVPMLGRLYLEPVRLGVLDIAVLQPIPRASFTLPVLACLIGLAVALVARARRLSRVLTAASGATGPLIVAVAYLISGPGISHEVSNQIDAYLGAMIAVVTGAVLSTLVALLPRRPTRTAPAPARTAPARAADPSAS